MSLSKPKTGSIMNWQPGAGGTAVTGPKMMGTTAKDDPETVSSTNELKQFEGKRKKPQGPFGLKGKEF